MDTYGADQYELQQNCVNDCPNHVNYGAIAFSERDGSFGYSFDYHSENDANQRALSDCSQNGKGCKVVLTFSENCAALAADDHNRYGYSLGDGEGDANGRALRQCAGHGGKKCEVKVSTCAR